MFPADRTRPGIRPKLVGLVVAALILAGACSPIEQDSDTQTGGGKSESNADDAAPTREDNFGTPAEASDVEEGGELVVALASDPDLLDPTQSRSLVSRYVYSAICEKLYDVDENAELVPQLAAELPDVSDDGRTVTIPLRDGIRFGDGTRFDAAAVKQSLDRHRTLETSGRKTEMGPIDRIEAPDDTTVVIHLSAPFAPLPAALADRAGMVMSPRALDKLGDDFASAPMCVGPFEFVRRVPQNSIEVKKNQHYYDADKVHLDSITFQIITDASIRAANLRAGEIQVADTLSTQDIPALEGEQGIEILESQSLGYQGVTFNIGNVDGVGQPAKPIDKPHAADPRVRRAFDYAVDRESLVRTVFDGIYAAACSPISPASEFSTEAAQECTPHDPKKAKQLLRQAGAETPYRIDMITTNTPDSLRIAQALQAMVQEAGFDIRISPVEFSALLDQQDRGDFEMLQLGWSGRIDPDSNITNFVSTRASQNVAGFSDETMDDLLTRAREAQDPAERAQLYGDVATELRESSPLVYLYRQRNLTGVSEDVAGVQVFPDGVIRAAFAGIHK